MNLAAATALSLLLAGGSAVADVTPDEAKAIAHDAWIYGYAPIQGYNTWYKQAVAAGAPEYVGGFNVFRHYADVFTPDNKDIVTPNNDTPYSWAWLDLRAEPVVVTVPEVPADRYYVLQFIDVFTYNMAYVGSRTTGNAAGAYMVAGPGWTGETPEGIAAVFHSETDIVGVLGRTELQGPDDLASVAAVQAGYGIQPLSAFAGTPAPATEPMPDFPKPDPDKDMTAASFEYLNFLLQFAEPPHPDEAALRERFAEIGIVPGRPWQPDPALAPAIDAGVEAAKADFEAVLDKTFTSNGLFGSRDALGDDYMTRAVAAAKGLFGNSIEEAWYGGYEVDDPGLKSVTFTADNLPEAKFFWSMTLYTLPDRLLFANPLNRYSIGDRSRDLVYGDDGSLTLYFGPASPGPGREANWLPSPETPYSLVMRVYGPGEKLIDGSWQLPQLEDAPR
jgi:hypothetical protein